MLRSQLAGSTLSFDELLIEGVPSNRSAHLITTATIGHIISLSADMDSMQLTLSQPQQAGESEQIIGTLPLPALHMHGTTTLKIDSQLAIASPSAFEQFTRDVLFLEQVQARAGFSDGHA